MYPWEVLMCSRKEPVGVAYCCFIWSIYRTIYGLQSSSTRKSYTQQKEVRYDPARIKPCILPLYKHALI